MRLTTDSGYACTVRRLGMLALALFFAARCVPSGNLTPSSDPTSGSDVGGLLVRGGQTGPVNASGDHDPNPPDDSDADLIAALLTDSDHDGLTDLDELRQGKDPFDPHDGPDIDGDGIANGDDTDVDGDGIENADDPDVDGDGILNGNDDDIDGDGLIGNEDDDDDGDGVPDLIDNDANGDGKPDCDCEHGVCSAFGGQCFCDPGWQGEECDEFHCKDVRNCNNGTCIGPNTCKCNPGWESVGSIPCAVYNCLGVSNCSFHGNCVGPNACDCDADWKGSPDCSRLTCASIPSTCDDNDPCTEDTCNTSTGCAHDPVCAAQKVCVDGDCLDPCAKNPDCPGGGSCRGGACYECENDSECGDGDRCTIDTCDPDDGCIHEQVPCPLFEECVFGKCVDPCDGDADCATGESCAGGGCFGDCTDDIDCGLDEICEDDICTPPPEDEGG